MLKSYEFTGTTPGFRLLECKALPVFSGSPSLFRLWFLYRAKEHPIFPEPDHYPTWLIFERIQEVVIAVFGVCRHNVQTMITESASLTQPFYLLNTDFQICVLAGKALDIYR